MEIRSSIPEGSSIGTVARLTGTSGAIVTIADITSWSLRMWDSSDPHPQRRRQPIYELLTVAPATTNTNTGLPATPLIVSDTYRMDGYWSGPAPGYNFLHVLTAADMAAYVPPVNLKGGHSYRLQYDFTTVWGPMRLVHRVSLIPGAES